MENFPQGGLSRLVTSRDLCTPYECVPLDGNFDLHKRLQMAKRQILNARQNETRTANVGKRNGGHLSRPRRASRSLQSDFNGPDFSFIHAYDSCGVDLNTSSGSSGRFFFEC